MTPKKDNWTRDPAVRTVSAVFGLVIFAVSLVLWVWAPLGFGIFVSMALAGLLIRVIKLEVHNGI